MTIVNATLVYLKDRENKKTLMLHRVKKNSDIHKGKWNGVGGKFEGCESPEECAIRETLEETGLIVSSPKFCGILTFPNFLFGNDWIVFVYEFEKFSGELIECDEGELSWIDDSKILDLNLWEGDKIFLPWVFESRLFSAKFVYENKKLIDYSVQFY
jgi:8-oxo-dGTP diphosphatase